MRAGAANRSGGARGDLRRFARAGAGAVAARRGRAAHGRAAGGDPPAAAERAAVVGLVGRRRRTAGRGLSEGAPGARSSRRRRSPHAARAPRGGRGGRPGAGARRAAEVVLEGEVAAAACQLLWANMMLHAVPDPPALLAQLAARARGRRLRHVLVLRPRHAEGAARAVCAPRLGRAGGSEFIDMHDLGDMLVQAGFADPVMDQERITLTFAERAALLAELRGLGGNAAPERYRGPAHAALARAPAARARRRCTAPTAASGWASRSLRPCLQGRTARQGGRRRRRSRSTTCVRWCARRGRRASERILIAISARRERIG